MPNPPEFEREVERMLREALDGEFERGNASGFGKPLPGAGERDDAYWWVRSWVERNRLDEEE